MKIAVVTPWFGSDLQGGAERVAWHAAHGLAERGHVVTVLTTCARSFSHDWSQNYHASGMSVVGNVTVMRFRVRKRNVDRFNRANARLMELTPSQLTRGSAPISADDSAAFLEDNINSDELTAHLASDPDYDVFLFLPYLYGPVLNEWKFVKERAFLQPCLHDEAYAYLPEVAEMMRGVRGILYNSEGEREIALRIFGPGIYSRGAIVGSAIEVHKAAGRDKDSIRRLPLRREDYFLYLGRRSDAKNLSVLLRAFRGFRKLYPQSRRSLVLAGPGSANYGDLKAGIVDLGIVSEDEKDWLLRNCRALVQPSKNESYSRAMMEAWLYGRPVVVNSECPATSRPVESTQAGWTARTEDEWITAFAFLDGASNDILQEVGERASSYVRDAAAWPSVLNRYEWAFGSLKPHVDLRPGTISSVHQVLDAAEYGETTTVQALGIRRALRAVGFESQIFSKNIDPRMAHEVLSERLPSGATVLVHAHRTARAAVVFADVPLRKILIVHGDEQAISQDLENVAGRYDAVYASSITVRTALSAEPFVPITDPDRWAIAPDPTLMSALDDGKTNILCVHAIHRKNCQRELLEMFAHYLSLDLNARLILAGRFDFEDPYYHDLLRLVHGSALSQHVLITGLVSEPALAALYSSAHLYCSLSEREHLGTTLVDAMWFDVPVVAYNTPSVKQTMGDAGILLREKNDPLALAALLKVLASDPSIRSSVLASQQQRRAFFEATAGGGQAVRMMAGIELIDAKYRS